jgi:aryl-phospho-beta-D-glucosidase BglC (GH1 family)
VNNQRLTRLARGINLPFWFWFGPMDLNEVKALYTEDDFAQIRQLGFTNVRVPLDIDLLLDDDAHPNHLLRKDTLAVLNYALSLIVGQGLAVQVNLHSTSARNPHSSRMEQDPALLELFIKFWRALAKHLRKHNPEYVIIEPLNEPIYYDNPQKWPPIQAQLIETIRQQAPYHTIIATAAPWSGAGALSALEPLDDPNLIYNFHFYEPRAFTYQGATWTRMPSMKMLSGLPYPSTPQNVEPIIHKLDDLTMINLVRTYGEERWNANKLAAYIQPVTNWAQQHGVHLICNEFGSHRKAPPPASRIRWTQDVRQLLEQHGIGWTLWEYDGLFGIARREESGRSVIDPEMVQALGLNLEAVEATQS